MALTLGLSLILVLIGLVVITVGTFMRDIRIVGGGTILTFIGFLVDAGTS